MNDPNPYAPPVAITDEDSSIVAELASEEGVWRDRHLIVTPLRSTLPPRCVKTNEPANDFQDLHTTWYPLLGKAKTICVSIPLGTRCRVRQQQFTTGTRFIGAMIAVASLLLRSCQKTGKNKNVAYEADSIRMCKQTTAAAMLVQASMVVSDRS
jgi:hypothetical protein